MKQLSQKAGLYIIYEIIITKSAQMKQIDNTKIVKKREFFGIKKTKN
jgi:hypothetical protein